MDHVTTFMTNNPNCLLNVEDISKLINIPSISNPYSSQRSPTSQFPRSFLPSEENVIKAIFFISFFSSDDPIE